MQRIEATEASERAVSNIIRKASQRALQSTARQQNDRDRQMNVLVVDAGESFPLELSNSTGMFGKQFALSLSEAGANVSVCALWLASGSLWARALLDHRRRLGYHSWQESSVRYNYLGMLGCPLSHRWRINQTYTAVSNLLDTCIRRCGTPDVANIHWGLSATNQCAMMHLKNLGIPYVLSEHSSRFLTTPPGFSQFEQSCYVEAARSASANTAVSSILSQRLSQLTGCTTFIVPNPLNPCFTNLPRPRNLEAPLRLITVGTGDIKRLDRIAAALLEVKETLPAIQLTVIGRPSKKVSSYLQALVKSNVDVQHFDSMTSGDLATQFQNADAYICSSDHETFGSAPLEALACGTPVITTTCGGPEDFVTANTGLLCDRNPQSLAQCIYRFSTQKEYWFAKRNELANSVQTAYSRASVGHRLQELLERSLS